MRTLLLFSVALFCGAQFSFAQFRFSSETGVAFNQYNVVRAPNDVSLAKKTNPTLFSFAEDFEVGGMTNFVRLEMAYTMNDKHVFQLTAAPLSVEYSGLRDLPIRFEGEVFEPSMNTFGSYKFNTYRFSYRYALIRKEKTRLEIGLTALLRDAKIELTQGNTTASNTDLGAVPLISFWLEKDLSPRLTLLLTGDALVGPRGRAEDVFAGVEFDVIKDRLFGKIGYRILEGGADVEQVYNFALFHFFDVGIVSKF
ncbi:MAG: hypothetical protein AAGG68_24590 [Bacteroidota bacterium]